MSKTLFLHCCILHHDRLVQQSDIVYVIDMEINIDIDSLCVTSMEFDLMTYIM